MKSKIQFESKQPESPDWPTWYDALSPLGSAVKYIAALSPRFNWVGIYVLKGNFLHLGPYIGAATEHTKIPVGRGICGRAVSQNADQNIGNVLSDNDYLACSLETRSELVVLIKDPNQRILGQIDIDSHETGFFNESQMLKVKEVADDLGKLWPN